MDVETNRSGNPVERESLRLKGKKVVMNLRHRNWSAWGKA